MGFVFTFQLLVLLMHIPDSFQLQSASENDVEQNLNDQDLNLDNNTSVFLQPNLQSQSPARRALAQIAHYLIFLPKKFLQTLKIRKDSWLMLEFLILPVLAVLTNLISLSFYIYFFGHLCKSGELSLSAEYFGLIFSQLSIYFLWVAFYFLATGEAIEFGMQNGNNNNGGFDNISIASQYNRSSASSSSNSSVADSNANSSTTRKFLIGKKENVALLFLCFVTCILSFRDFRGHSELDNFMFNSTSGLIIWVFYFAFFVYLLQRVSLVHGGQYWNSEQSHWFFMFIILFGS